MAFYHNFAGKIQKTGQDALDKTKKTAESMKVKSAISDLEKDIQSVYANLEYAEDGQIQRMTVRPRYDKNSVNHEQKRGVVCEYGVDSINLLFDCMHFDNCQVA